MKAIFGFMTREQLVALSGVSRRFFSVINSLPFTTRPLCRIEELSINWTSTYPAHRAVMYGGLWRFDEKGLPYFVVIGPGNALESLLEQQWLQFRTVSPWSDWPLTA